MRKYVLLLLAGFILSSCAKDIVISYNAQAQKTGNVVLTPDKPLYKTDMLLNDSLMFENKAVRSITLEGLPVGPHKINLKSDYTFYKDNMDVTYEPMVSETKKQNETVAVPAYSTSFYVIGALVLSSSLLLIL